LIFNYITVLCVLIVSSKLPHNSKADSSYPAALRGIRDNSRCHHSRRIPILNHANVLHHLPGFVYNRFDLLHDIAGIEDFIALFTLIAGNIANDQQTEAQFDGFGSHALIGGLSAPHALHFVSSFRVFQFASHFSGLGAYAVMI